MPAKKAAGKKRKSNPNQPPPAPSTPRDHFPVVGLGASAGGLDALKAFFAQVTRKSGLAYIVNVHLTPKQPSLMPELLQRICKVKVTSAMDGEVIAPDHVYVVPSDKILGVHDGTIRLLDIGEHRPATLPIDRFLRSLATDRGPFAVGVILSGTGTDGTLGIKEIKAKDGLVLVQSEETAAYDGMPRSAVGTGVVDMVLAPEAMPLKMLHYFEHARQNGLKKPDVPAELTHNQQEWLSKIFAVLRARIGHDFSLYKVNTLLRRINRRMGLNQIGEPEHYLRFLRDNPIEVEALFREMLIGVTSFFRDAESFEALKTRILPPLLDQMPEDATLRAWIPGCSTGEEVYSLAMVIRELLDSYSKRINLQLFGTDIDNFAIDKAREGIFAANIVTEVSKERLNRFFIKEGEMFRIRKEIRDCAVFSVQDLIKDPPFSRLHLLSCRNLLIYLDGEAQKKLLPLFHYTLNPEGVLMLGSSETIGGYTRLFDVLDKKWKIFRRREVPLALRQQIEFPSGAGLVETGVTDAQAAPTLRPKVDMGQLARGVILERFAPTAVLIDSKGAILYVQGRTGKYLETTSGAPSHDILDMAREGLRIELSSAIREARTSHDTVLRRKIAVKTNGDVQLINLYVCPLETPKELSGRLLVVLEDVEASPASGTPVDPDPERQAQESIRLANLEKELQNTRESHQTTIEELESSNEELKSTNEELQSANEELQSTNEELESSKEELQSLNEELQTVNAELQSKVEELSAAHDDMRNLLNSTQIATIFVDNDIRIRRFTPEATAIINLIQTDIGRPLRHVVSNLDYKRMIADASEVLDDLLPREREVVAKDGQWYKMRIVPYRTTDNRIDGAVLTFASIDEQKKAQQGLSDSNLEISQAWRLVRSVFDMNREPMVVLDRQARIVIANTAFSQTLQLAPEKLDKEDLFAVRNGFLAQTDLRDQLKRALEKGKDFQIDIDQNKPQKTLDASILKARIIPSDGEGPAHILLQLTKEP